MTATYTSIAIVKYKVPETTAADAAITQFIEDAQGLIDGILGFSLLSSFDAAKHAVIRQVCTDLAAMMCISSIPTNYTTTSEAALKLDILYLTFLAGIKLLSDDRFKNILKEV